MSSSKENLIFSILIGIGVVLILGAAFYFFKPGQFKTYVNTPHNFSIKYPASWKMLENKDGVVVMFVTPAETSLDVFQDNVNIVVQDLPPKGMGLNEYSATAIRQMEAVFKENLNIIESKKINWNGDPAYKFFYVGKGPQGNFKISHYWKLVNNKAYQLTYTSTEESFDAFWPQVNRMISSFKLQ